MRSVPFFQERIVMKRPSSFQEIKGHDWLIRYLIDHIKKGTLAHFIIFEGPEGLGKTSISDLVALSLVYGLNDSEENTKAYEEVVVNNRSNDNIKRFACSVDGGKDVAKIIKDEMNTTFTVKGPKVLICDECHGLSEAAQDVFLSETEFLSKDVYILMLTTEAHKLKASLRSRAVPIHLNPLKRSDMITVLKQEVADKQLNIQQEDIVLGMIADWAECKPRAGLNILNAFSSGSSVSANTIRNLIGSLDVSDVLPLLSSLSGSLTFGLSYIAEMQINESLVNVVIECINIKDGQGSYKVKLNELKQIKDSLINVTTQQLVTFLYGITKTERLSRRTLINAYINAHSFKESISKPDTRDTKSAEMVQRSNIQLSIEHEALQKAPTFEDLIPNSSVIVRGKINE